MCDAQTKQQIVDTVEELMAAERAFTQYDVFLILEEAGATAGLAYWQLRGEIRDAIGSLSAQYEYDRTVAAAVPGTPFLYFPFDVDGAVDGYDPDAVRQSLAPKAAAAAATPAAPKKGILGRLFGGIFG